MQTPSLAVQFHCTLSSCVLQSCGYKNSSPNCFCTPFESLHNKTKNHPFWMAFVLAQREGFEPSCDCSQTDFEELKIRLFLSLCIPNFRNFSQISDHFIALSGKNAGQMQGRRDERSLLFAASLRNHYSK